MTERNSHVPLEQIREYVQNKTYPNGYEGKFLLDILYLLLLLGYNQENRKAFFFFPG